MPIAAVPLLTVLVALACFCVQATLDVRSHVPDWVRLRSDVSQVDLDGDGAVETAALSNGTLQVFAGPRRLYATPREWAISDAFYGEIDDDPGTDMMLVTWKRGTYGNSHPFWVERNDAEISQHIFVMKYRDGDLVPVWMSSTLESETHSTWLDENNHVHLVHDDGAETVWQWDFWGLKRLDEAPGEPQGEEGEELPAPNESTAESTGQPAGQAEAHASGTATLLAVGDNIIHSTLYGQMRTSDEPTFDFAPLYAPVADSIRAADAAAVVQETPLVNEPSAYSGYPSFGTPTAVGDALADAGFDIVCAATNHANDKGTDGIAETIAFWRTRHPDITLLGMHARPQEASALTIRSVGGIDVALLDCTYGLNGNDLPDNQAYLIDTLNSKPRLMAGVQSAERSADCTICFLHVGDEYAQEPSNEQRALVEECIDAGADAVICSHPHVVYPAERVTTAQGSSGVVFWSLGNFASHQDHVRTILGGMARMVIEKGPGETGAHIASFELDPIVCHYTAYTTAVYPLQAYTDDLAAQHFLNEEGPTVTLDELWRVWEQATGR